METKIEKIDNESQPRCLGCEQTTDLLKVTSYAGHIYYFCDTGFNAMLLEYKKNSRFA